jgi:HSP20 family molecular chaperone IbpA
MNPSSQPASQATATQAKPAQNPPPTGVPVGASSDAGAAQAPTDRGRYSGSLQTSRGQGQVSGRSAQDQTAPAMRPAVDIYEDEGGVTLLADLPGVDREHLELRVDGDNLVIEATAQVPEVAEMELVHGELLSPRFHRSFTLSRDLDPQKIEATLERGVLRLRLHKVEQAKPRRIEVQAR